MKCYECKSLKSDKLKEPCCSCIGRPHDLCCKDNFVAVKDEPVSASESWEKRGTKYPGGPRAAYEQGFSHGEENERKRHQPKQSFDEWVESEWPDTPDNARYFNKYDLLECHRWTEKNRGYDD